MFRWKGGLGYAYYFLKSSWRAIKIFPGEKHLIYPGATLRFPWGLTCLLLRFTF